MPAAKRADRRIDYRFTPAGEADGATPVVLVPGLGGGARLFGTLPRRFARAGLPSVTFDPVGLGASSPHSGPYDLDAAGADVLAVLDDLGLEQCDLVGTSLGGKVALCTAYLAPHRVRRVVLLASAAVATPRGRRVYRFFEILAQRLEPPELGEVLATFLFGTTFHTNRPDLIADMVRAMRLDSATRAVMIAQARALHGFDGTTRARALRSPCLCLAGAEDTLTGPASVAATAELMADSTFEVIPNAGHTLLVEAPAVFDRITGFLRSVMPA